MDSADNRITVPRPTEILLMTLSGIVTRASSNLTMVCRSDTLPVMALYPSDSCVTIPCMPASLLKTLLNSVTHTDITMTEPLPPETVSVTMCGTLCHEDNSPAVCSGEETLVASLMTIIQPLQLVVTYLQCLFSYNAYSTVPVLGY